MKTAVITGSAGFIGTNLVNKLLGNEYKVIGIDNFNSSEKWKAEINKKNKNYEFFEFDITNSLEPIIGKSDLIKQNGINEIYNLACPASPPRYMKLPFETIAVNTIGLINILELANKYKAKLLHSSTSEVYGDPHIHPQPESYRGNVNTVGPRSCYDEGKRISETICYEYKDKHNIDIKLVRIFNTYGPYMDPNDGRVITNFINQAIKNKDLTIYGDGSQTRSFQFITDLLDGFDAVMKTEKDFFGPINLGNPEEFTINELADIVLENINTKSKKVFVELPKDDPKQRKPDITLARSEFNWEPRTKLKEGLKHTIQYYKTR